MKKALVLVAGLAAAMLGFFASVQLRSDFTTLSGADYRWNELQGQWVVVNYFAEWCAPCLREVPELNAFSQYSQAQPDLQLFGVSYDPLTVEQLKALAQKYSIEFSLIKPTDPMPTLPMAKPQQLPATYIISPQGEVLKTLWGEQTAEGLKRQLSALQAL